MKRLKKTLQLLSLVGCVFAFASCSSGGESATSTNNTTANTDDGGENSVVDSENDYRFEAEYVNLEGLEGLGTSGSPSGKSLAVYDSEASNKYALANLGPDSPITFTITSSAAGEATFRGCFGNNSLGNCAWNPTTMIVTVNGTAITYNEFNTSSGSTTSTQNYIVRSLGTINLVSGENTIVISAGENNYLNNCDVLPSIDYIRLTTTSATLDWDPVESNLD